MRILHITDSHGTVKNPAGRKDVYYISFLKKFYELSYIIKQQKIDMVIHTGDLFHTSRVSDKFAGQLAEILKIYQIPFYVVPGNHDIDGYNLDTIDQTKLGLLYKTGIIRELDRDNSINVKIGNIDIHIEGQEFCPEIDNGSQDEYQLRTANGDINILCVHGYLTDVHQPDGVRCTYVDQLSTNADIILSGHWHRKICYETDDIGIYNPGSMMRVEQTEYNKNHKPQYGILEITEDSYNYTFHEFLIAEPSTKVFDYDSKYENKQNEITLENFKNSFANSSNTSVTRYTPGKTLLSSLEDVVSDVVDNSTEEYIRSLKQEALDQLQDAFNDPVINVSTALSDKGYIPLNIGITIEKVKIHNFQSHKDSEFSFTDGLNVILGESNSGKTSIIRAMLWCIYNKPNGTDFITAGENECSVEITLSNGWTIKRSRTLKDTGTYVVTDGTNATGTVYKGFSNNIPIEVKNIFQMPTVAISKDISVNLNVMGQLESSFMVSDSPQQRAIMIGRLTGVNVLDGIIKKNNSTILGNTKTIKTLEEILDKERDALSKRPNLSRVEMAIIDIKAIEDYSFITADKLYDLQEKIKKYESIVKSINNEEQNIERYDNILSSEQFITKLDNTNDIIKNIERIIKAYSDVESQINGINNTMSRLESITRLNDLPDRLNNAFSRVNGLDKHVNDITICNKKIEENESNIHSMDEMIKSIESILKVIKYLGTLQKIGDLIELHNQLSEQIVAIEQDINSTSNEIEFNQKQLLDFYIKDDKCPCCGKSCKSMTTKTKEHMLSFLLSN